MATNPAMSTYRVPLAALCLASLTASAADPVLHSFKKIQLTSEYYSEGANFGDLNRDGVMDIVSGPYWYEGPDYQKKHELYPPKPQDRNKYADNFFSFVQDFNGDGWNDVFVIGFPGKPAIWYENPGKAGFDKHWQKHVCFDWVSNESPHFTDLVGDPRPELVCTRDGRFGYATVNWAQPLQPWTFHAISEDVATKQFGHGLGVGDIDGDRRLDIINKDGWYQQPASLAGDPLWKFHPYKFAPAGAQMYAYDVNGDGLNDVITSLEAHGYGLAWFEQVKKDGAITFVKHPIMGSTPAENRYGVAFSELHAVDLFDVDGDGLKDIVTGKTYWSHHQQTPSWNDGAVVYWFKLVRHGKEVDFVPYQADDDSGIGRQVVAGDLNGDGLPDIVTGNMKGTFALLHKTKKVSPAEWEKAQPKVVFPNPTVTGRASVPASPNQSAAAKNVGSSEPSPHQKHEGIKPVGKDGQPLNLGFENGTLNDWTATGNAFNKQPVKGDTVAARLKATTRTDRSDHEGQYWIGGYEMGGDNLKGTLTSAPFKVTQPFASFLVGGGKFETTRVELVRADTQEVIFIARGVNRENLRPVAVDLQPYLGKEILIRLVDDQTGGWGHINFDDFKFHEQKPVFPGSAGVPPAVPSGKRAKPAAGETPALPANLPPVDDIKFAGLSPEQAVKEMTVPPGFKAHLFAGEPDVRNPIAFCIDDRGRLWVAEGMTYPQRAPEGQGQDRILVFEDTNGDHKFDKRTVFMEGLNLVSGLEIGFGGVWVGAAPYLMFIPMKDGDEPKPAGPPQMLLEGWSYQDTHETLNTFTWGPDGWLYGLHGVFTHSHVKTFGAPDSERQYINAGVWRFHPTKHVFEVFAEGTSNPWGIDFDERGQCIIEACVIPHLWHMIQGARYQRQGGTHYPPSLEEERRVAPGYFTQNFGARAPTRPDQPFIYDDIKTIADHVHYAGATPHAGNNRSASAGGGHAHAGLMVYLGGSWPEEYRGKLFMNNIHGARINMDIPERAGSGFTGKHGADFINFNDKASQIINLLYDQNGSVYMIDWYDLNQCHRNDRAAHDYENGRIFKIVYGDTKATKVDLQKASDEELVGCLTHKNAWYARHAQRILQERAAADDAVKTKVFKSLPGEPPGYDPINKLRCLWALHVTGGLDDGRVQYGLHRANEFVRAWTIQLACEDKKPSPTALKQFAAMAKSDPSPVVRLYLASALQRLPVEQRWDILAGLVSHAEDTTDHNLPLMAWYAGEPLVTADLHRALDLALAAQLPNYLNFTARRIAGLGTPDAMSALVKTLGHVSDDAKRLVILRGMGEALRAQRKAPLPAGWDVVAAKLAGQPALRSDVNMLSAKFGSQSAFASLREQLLDSHADAASRASALDTLVNTKDPSLAPGLQRLLGDAALRGPALRALAGYDDAWTPWLVLAVYPKLNPTEKRDALSTLVSRAGWARQLVAAVESKAVPVHDLTAETVRQLRNFGQADLNTRLDQVWGSVRESPAEKQNEIEHFRTVFLAGGSLPGDASRGRAVYDRICTQCHTLFEAGGKVGPDLTGSARADINYILQNVVDPNAVIPNDYRASTVETKDDRSIMGIILQQDDRAVTIVTATETSTIPRNEIKSIRQSEISMMPEGLLTPLAEQEVRDLIYYLRSPGQAPLPK